MNATKRDGETAAHGLAKCPTWIQGLDEITGGGLPRGRPTLVRGGAGSGKTLLAKGITAIVTAELGNKAPRSPGGIR